MPEEPVARRLAAILAADVAGYSRLMAADESGTLARLKRLRAEVIEPKIAEFHGQIVGSAGNSLLVEFASAVNAVQCAVETQEGLANRNASLPEDRRMIFRIGVNLGDVIAADGTIYGDGVNIAARLEKLAGPGSVCIGRNVYDQVKSKLAYTYADLGEQRIHNIAEPVRAYRVESSNAVVDPSPGLSAKPALPPPDKPSIAILPFQNMSGDPEQQYFSDGITEDIITELSRFRSLFVIARNSSFAFRGERIDIAEIARRLGVQYVVEGSVRRSGNRVRITAQLIDSANGAHLWAERYDRELEDIFAVQDEVVRTVVATVAGRVDVAGAQLAKRKPPESLVAYDYVLRGLEQLSLLGEEPNSEARRLFEKAVQLDPEYAAGHAYLAVAVYMKWITSRASEELDRALASARQALAFDENDSRCHRILSMIYIQLRQYDRAEFHSDRSIALNPNDALTAMYRAGILRHLGRAEEGVEWARKAMRLNPYHPNWYWNSLAFVLHSAGRYADALDAYGRISERPSFYHAYVAACHAELGRMEEARSHTALALQARPDFSVAAWGKRMPFKDEADRQRFLEGLRKAGLPD